MYKTTTELVLTYNSEAWTLPKEKAMIRKEICSADNWENGEFRK